MSKLQAPYTLEAAEAREWIRAARWRHYVYLLCSPTGDVFYVGKGVDGRLFQHAADAQCGDESEKAAEIRRLGADLRYCFFAFFPTNDKARIGESLLIERYFDVLLNARADSIEGVMRSIMARDLSEIAHEHIENAIAFEELAAELRQRAARALEASVFSKRLKSERQRA